MIAIAGGTGRLGSLLARRLAERGLDVCVITRDPARAAHLSDLPAQIVTADVRDRAGIHTALEARGQSCQPCTASPARAK